MKKEMGRSMLEMLGVLAIIGMLAIGGVWGVRKAFTKHNANNLIEDVRFAGFIVVDEMFETVLNADGDVALNDKITPQTNYIFKAFAEENSTTTFGILAQNVPFNVCEEVSTRKVDWLEEIRPNGLDNVCKEDNEISFFFNTELTTEPEFEENTCRSNRDCPVARPYCRGGYCSKCEDGMLELNSGICTECPAGANQRIWHNVTKENCYTCGKNYISVLGDMCTNCSASWSELVRATKEECDRCPNRCWDETQQKCLLSEVGNAFNDNGICRYNTCGVGEFLYGTQSGGGVNKCMKCPVGANQRIWNNVTKENCHTCGQNYMFVSIPMCTDCSASWSEMVNATQDECERCTNRYFDETTQKCLLCPAGQKATADGLSCAEE